MNAHNCLNKFQIEATCSTETVKMHYFSTSFLCVDPFSLKLTPELEIHPANGPVTNWLENLVDIYSRILSRLCNTDINHCLLEGCGHSAQHCTLTKNSISNIKSALLTFLHNTIIFYLKLYQHIHIISTLIYLHYSFEVCNQHIWINKILLWLLEIYISQKHAMIQNVL